MRLCVWAAVFVAAATAARERNITVENDSPLLTYSPDSAWNTILDSTDKYSGGSLRTTSTPLASVSLVFNGSYIQYVADTGPQRGLYTVLIDGIFITQQSGSSATRHSSTVLFSLPVDPARPHNITIVNAGVANGLPQNPIEVALDYFMFTTTNAPPSDTNKPGLTTGNPPIGLVLGGTIGGAALVLSFILLALVVAPPDPPQLFQPLPSIREPSTRRSDSSRNELYRPLGSRTPSPFRSDSDASSRSHSDPRVPSSQGSGSPLIRPFPLPNGSSRSSTPHSSRRDRNPFSSSSSSVHLGVPYTNPFASTSHVELDRHSHSRTSSSEIIPLQQQGRLPAGQGFICANCSIELARERSARMQNGGAGSSSLRHLVATTSTGARR